MNLIKQIKFIYKYLRLKTVLLPLGYAPNHEDLVTLERIFLKGNFNEECILIKNANIFDCAYVISHSKCYIGTSLHGAITAISYSIPHTSLVACNRKLINYMKTWKSTNIFFANVQNLISNIVMLLENRDIVEKCRKMSINLCKENNQNIIDIIECS